MTSHKEHIQTLIAEIDSVLQRTNPRLPWVMSGEVAQQRQMLERVRNFLVALQQTLPPPDGMRPPLDGVQTLAAQMGIGTPGTPGGGTTADMTPYEMMQAILQEVSYLRANLTPASLQQPSANQSQLTAELLQVLMSRLQENLSQQIAQTLDQIRHQTAYPPAPPMLSGGMPSTPVPYEQLQNLRSRSDQMLVNLDSTLNVVFESLQRNIQSYQEALSQGLERMYSMGQQSEYTLKQLIEHLTQQLKQEASSYLLSTPGTELPPAPPVPTPPTATVPPAPMPPAPAHPAFPYAGSELLSSEISGSDSTLPPQPFAAAPSDVVPPLDSAIESWLQSVSAMNLDDTPPETALVPDLPPLDLSDLDLGTGDLTSTLPAGDDFVTAAPEFSFTSASPIAPPPASPVSPSTPAPSEAIAEDDTADIDAVLKLLEELSAEVETSAQAASLEDAEAQLEQMLNAPPTPSGEAQPGDLPEDAREELDEFLQDDFYQSLFGSETAIAADPEPAVPTAPDPALEVVFELDPLPPAADTEVEAEPPADDTFAALGLDLEAEPAPASLFDLQPPQDSETTPPLYLELPADLFEAATSPGTPELTASPLPAAIDQPVERPDQQPDLAIADLLPSLLTPETPSLEAELVLPEPLFNAPPTSDANLELALPDVAIDTASFPLELNSTPAAPPTVDPGDSLTAWFQDVTEEATRSIPVEPPVVRQPPPVVPVPPAAEPLFLGDDLFGQAPALEPSEDQFTRADAEESLIPSTNLEPNGVSLELDDMTLSSLSEDLFSLEGQAQQPTFTLSDFALQASEPGAVPPAIAPPPASPDDDLSLDSFAADLTTPATPAPPFYQASPAIENLSMEGFADLFGSDPPPTPLPPPAAAPNEALPFTLNNAANLFEVPQSPEPDRPSLPSVDSDPSPFTLEGMDDLFGDAPAIDRGVALPPLPTPPLGSDPVVSPEIPFTLEGMNDLFDSAPPLPRPPVSPANQTVLPPAPPPSREVTPARGIPPFKPELFHPDDVMEPAPDFQLERLDNLFADPTATPIAESPASASIPDQQTLDAAFESLLGTPPSAPLPSQPTPTPAQKKKTP